MPRSLARLPPPPTCAVAVGILRRHGAMALLESAAMGIDGSIVVTAGLCAANAHQGVTEAERPAKDQEAAIPFMDCRSFDRGIRATAAAQSPWPMVLARSQTARPVAGIAR